MKTGGFLLATAICVAVLSSKASAQVPITYYDFENNATRTSFETTVEQQINLGNSVFSRVGLNNVIVGNTGAAATLYGGPVTGSAIDSTTWPSGAADPGVAATNYYQFAVNTTGFTGTSLSFDVFAGTTSASYPFVGALISTTGPAGPYSSLMAGFDPGLSTWSTRSANFPAAANNNSSVVIRIYGYFSDNTVNGTMRLDNVRIFGSTTVAGTVRTMLDESALFTSMTSGLTGSVFNRANLTVTGAGTVLTASSPLAFNGGTLGISTAGSLNIGSNLLIIGTTETFTIGAGINFVVGSGAILRNAGTVTPTGTLTFQSGARYQHNQNNGTVPTSTWNSGSTCEITGQVGGTNAPGGLGQSFSNFTWNCASQTANTSAGGVLTTVNGNLTIQTTAGGSFRLAATTNPTLNIGGDLIVNGGTFIFSTGAGAPIVNVAGNVTLAGGTLQPATGAGVPVFNVAGNWTRDGGTFTPGTGAVTFNGSVAQAIGGSLSTAFSGLTIANTGADSTTLNTNGSVSGVLTLTKDLTIATDIILTQSGTSAGAGDVLGTVRRADVGATTRAFGNPNVQITNGGSATVDVSLAKGAPGGFAAAVARGYSIIPATGTGAGATVRLRYLDPGELNGNAEAGLRLWRAVGAPSGTWTDQGFTTRDATNNWVELTGVAGFSQWTLAAAPSVPTAVKLTSFSGIENNGEVMLQWRTGYEAHNLGYVVYREQSGRRTAITPSLIAGSALLAGRNTQLTSGLNYTWYDQVSSSESGVRSQKGNQQSAISNQKSAVTYWLEDVDLNGTRTLHGPIAPLPVVAPLPAKDGKLQRA
ncbi:MAG TPA: hypothetical protein VGC61_10320, partial [Pyrinomonadaceae bacterium]